MHLDTGGHLWLAAARVPRRMEIFERIRYARDRALAAEEEERQRVADAENAEVERAASVRLATRQAVREALDDVLDESSEPERASQG